MLKLYLSSYIYLFFSISNEIRRFTKPNSLSVDGSGQSLMGSGEYSTIASSVLLEGLPRGNATAE